MLRYAIFLLLLVGCQAPSNDKSLHIDLDMPSELRRGSARFQELVRQAEALKVSFHSKDGWVKGASYPPVNWEAILIPELDFPKSKSDSLTVRVSVISRAREILKGEGTLSGEDYYAQKRRLAIKLHN